MAGASAGTGRLVQLRRRSMAGGTASRPRERNGERAGALRGAFEPLQLADLIQFLDGVAIENLADERGVTPREIVAAMPKGACRFVSPARFVDVMNEIAQWGPVTIPLRIADGVVELTDRLPRGQARHGHFYWIGAGPLRGHLRIDRCSAIALVERSFMGRASASVLFFNHAGGIMFNVFLARNADGGPDARQLAMFRALGKRLSRRSSPTDNRKQARDE